MARPKGAVSESTIKVRMLARKHGPMAVAQLAKLAETADSDSAKIAAIKELLDRAYGKSVQPLDGDGEGGPMKIQVSWSND